MDTIIKAENLCFEYKNEESGEVTKVLKNVSAEVKRGEFLAILGHNGSGKSTFAKHINAVLTPNSGKMYVNGLDTSDEGKLFEIRKTAGMVFQNPDNQMVANIVEDDVAFAPENLGVPREEIRRRVDSVPRRIVGTVADNGLQAYKAGGHTCTHLRFRCRVSADDGVLQRQKGQIPDVLEVVLLHILSRAHCAGDNS